MNLLYDITWYGAWWLLFVAVAFLSARYFGCRGAISGAIALAVLIYVLDAMWIFADMKDHPEHGRDADFVFIVGVVFRVVLFNLMLLPVTLIALKVRARNIRLKHDTNTA